jgi:hypothetical protein
MSDNLDKLDYDVSYGADFQKRKVEVIDVYHTQDEAKPSLIEDDKYVAFSAELIKCFREKMKESQCRLRLDSLIEAYRNGEDTYTETKGIGLPVWCMASVNSFLNIAEGKNYSLNPSEADIEKAEKDLEKFDLKAEFTTTTQLYLETRKETIDHAVTAQYRYF